MAFLPDGSGLVVSHDTGLALWRCAGAGWPEAGELSVTVDGPAEAKVGAPATYAASAGEGAAPVVFELLVDDAPQGEPGLSPVVTWTPDTPGVHTLRVVARDGLATGAAAVEVEVLEGAE